MDPAPHHRHCGQSGINLKPISFGQQSTRTCSSFKKSNIVKAGWQHMRERGCKKSGEKCHGRPGFRHSTHINEFFLPRHENLGREEKSNMWGWLALRLIADESAEVEWKDLYDDDDPYRPRFITRSRARWFSRLRFVPSFLHADVWIWGAASKINTGHRGTCSEAMMISLYNRKRFISLGHRKAIESDRQTAWIIFNA